MSQLGNCAKFSPLLPPAPLRQREYSYCRSQLNLLTSLSSFWKCLYFRTSLGTWPSGSQAQSQVFLFQSCFNFKLPEAFLSGSFLLILTQVTSGNGLFRVGLWEGRVGCLNFSKKAVRFLRADLYEPWKLLEAGKAQRLESCHRREWKWES